MTYILGIHLILLGAGVLERGHVTDEVEGLLLPLVIGIILSLISAIV